MSLSFSTTNKGVLGRWPAWLIASNAIPPVRAPLHTPPILVIALTVNVSSWTVSTLLNVGKVCPPFL